MNHMQHHHCHSYLHCIVFHLHSNSLLPSNASNHPKYYCLFNNNLSIIIMNNKKNIVIINYTLTFPIFPPSTFDLIRCSRNRPCEIGRKFTTSPIISRILENKIRKILKFLNKNLKFANLRIDQKPISMNAKNRKRQKKLLEKSY